VLPSGLTTPIVTPVDFGFDSLRVNGRPATDRRPAMILLVNFRDHAMRKDRDCAYYQRLFFGPGFPSVSGYYQETSRGRFSLRDVGCFTHTAHDVKGTTQDESTYAGAIVDEVNAIARQAIETRAAAGFDFRQFDVNRDGVVTSEELIVNIVFAGPGAPLRTWNRPVHTAGSGVRISLNTPMFEDGHALASITHEVTHSLGALDVYGSGIHGTGMTLMAATSDRRDDLSIMYLDPWHRINFGWVEPRIVALTEAGGREILDAPQVPDSARAHAESRRPIILYSPARGTSEYFILEYRNPGAATGAGYDGGLADWRNNRSGIAVWHVRVDAHKVPIVIPGIVIGAGPNGRLDSIVRGDDHAQGLEIRPGPDRVLQTALAGDDFHFQDRFVLMRGAPNARRGDGAMLVSGDGSMAVDWANERGQSDGFAVRLRAVPSASNATGAWVEWSPGEWALPRVDYAPPSVGVGTSFEVRGLIGTGRPVSLISATTAEARLAVSSYTGNGARVTVPSTLPPGSYQIVVYDSPARTRGALYPIQVTR
jgi:M6 family metalloprotease-like protein